MVTKRQIEGYVKEKLTNSDGWAIRACKRIYDYQTSDEQAQGMTSHDNGVGFSAVDAEILSSFAQQILEFEKGRTKYNSPLSVRQKEILKKRIVRYWRQIIQISEKEKLENQVKEWVEKRNKERGEKKEKPGCGEEKLWNEIYKNQIYWRE